MSGSKIHYIMNEWCNLHYETKAKDEGKERSVFFALSESNCAHKLLFYFIMACDSYDENCDVSAIFFDLDNTLIQTRKGDSRACNKVCNIFITY